MAQPVVGKPAPATIKPHSQTLYRDWVNNYVTKDFLLGKVNRTKDTVFVHVGPAHTERNIYLLRPVYEAFKEMYDAALADGVKLVITSGHRTFVDQVCEWQLKYDNAEFQAIRDPVERARKLLQYRSVPGSSRHHWGTDIDMNSIKLHYFETAEGKKMYEWLQENAHRFGFHQPYTAFNKYRQDGYNEEKWHWSYLPIASLMLEKFEKEVSMEDFKGFHGDKAVQQLSIISKWVRGIDSRLYMADL